MRDALDKVMRPRLAVTETVLPYLRRMEASGHFANAGPLTRELEARHAARLGVPADQVVAVASATAGLTGALTVSPARHWAVPAYTFAATGHAVVASGGDMEIHDVDHRTWLISAPAASSGLVVVVPFGCGIDLRRWPSTSEVVVDAAASLGAREVDLASLPASWSVVFSLHATKVMPCGEGGLVVCGDRSRADELRRWAHFGLDDRRAATAPGANALMPEPSAAFGLAALDSWRQERDEWRAARVLSDGVTARLGLDGPPSAGSDAHPFWIVRLHSAEIAALAEVALTRAGIATRRWWGPGLHRMPAFRQWAGTDCPVTDDVAGTTLGLPFWRGLESGHVERIGEVIGSVLEDRLAEV